jgi:hypothetical protein
MRITNRCRFITLITHLLVVNEKHIGHSLQNDMTTVLTKSPKNMSSDPALRAQQEDVGV